MFPKLSIIVMFMSFLTTLGLQCPFAQKNDYNTLDKNFSKKHTGRTSSPSPTRVELHTLTSVEKVVNGAKQYLNIFLLEFLKGYLKCF